MGGWRIGRIHWPAAMSGVQVVSVGNEGGFGPAGNSMWELPGHAGDTITVHLVGWGVLGTWEMAPSFWVFGPDDPIITPLTFVTDAFGQSGPPVVDTSDNVVHGVWTGIHPGGDAMIEMTFVDTTPNPPEANNRIAGVIVAHSGDTVVDYAAPYTGAVNESSPGGLTITTVAVDGVAPPDGDVTAGTVHDQGVAIGHFGSRSVYFWVTDSATLTLDAGDDSILSAVMTSTD